MGIEFIVKPDNKESYAFRIPWDDFRIAPPLKRISLVPRDQIIPYDNVYVYIIDEPEDEDDIFMLSRDPTKQRHAGKCRLIRNMFSHNFGPKCYVKSVSFSPRGNESQLNDYFAKELQGLTRRDLAILYYHGLAGEHLGRCSWSGKQPRLLHIED